MNRKQDGAYDIAKQLHDQALDGGVLVSRLVTINADKVQFSILTERDFVITVEDVSDDE